MGDAEGGAALVCGRDPAGRCGVLALSARWRCAKRNARGGQAAVKDKRCTPTRTGDETPSRLRGSRLHQTNGRSCTVTTGLSPVILNGDNAPPQPCAWATTLQDHCGSRGRGHPQTLVPHKPAAKSSQASNPSPPTPTSHPRPTQPPPATRQKPPKLGADLAAPCPCPPVLPAAALPPTAAPVAAAAASPPPIIALISSRRSPLRCS